MTDTKAGEEGWEMGLATADEGLWMRRSEGEQRPGEERGCVGQEVGSPGRLAQGEGSAFAWGRRQDGCGSQPHRLTAAAVLRVA